MGCVSCYTKLKDHERLDEFIKASERGAGTELPFELDTAIRVCRQAGYYAHALYLAGRYGQHADYLRIQIEDQCEWADALQYMRQLGPAGVSAYVFVHGSNEENEREN